MSALWIDESALAIEDIDSAARHYLLETGEAVAIAFVEDVERVYRLLADHPHIGSPRYGHALNIPGLRHHGLRNYPWLVLYIAQIARIQVVRVLDARRDIPTSLATDEG